MHPSFGPDRRQRVKRHLAVSATAQVYGLGKFPAALDQAVPAHVVTPTPAGRVKGHREEQCHSAVATGRINYAAFDGNVVPARAEVGLQFQAQFVAGAAGKGIDV